MNADPLATPLPIDDFSLWLASWMHLSVLLELAVLGVCVGVSWGVVALLRRALSPDAEYSIWFGRRLLDGVLFPAIMLGSGYLGYEVLRHQHLRIVAFKVVIPVLVSLVVIRVGVKVLQVAFRYADWLRPIERSISWAAWLTMVMWVSGLLPLVLNALDDIQWKIGNSHVSVLTLIEGILTAAWVLLLCLWVSSAIEARLLRKATGSELSLRKAVSNAARALLLFVGLMVALSSVGIDLSALSVLGGAIGVGIGFGLQKLAANYVSGFVILTERSMRIGDNVKVDNFEGRITDIRARFTVIRSLSGREAIVPNEMLITGRVENLSLADTRVWQSSTMTVGGSSDVELVSRLLVEAAAAQPRVLKDPGPSAALSAFAADGLEFTLGYWIADPEGGTLGLKSDINKRILASLREHGIDLPYPQRVVHLRNSPL